MTVGVWDPGKGGGGVTAGQLDALLADLAAADLDALPATLPASVQHDYTWMMTLEPDSWAVLGERTTAELCRLAQFFTVAEMELAGWHAGKRSPVIAIVRELKARDAFDADLRRWIKQHTDNRYLPNGSAL